jgi:hypothetical protein
MTQDLYRLFTCYYLKPLQPTGNQPPLQYKFGHFVCDFIEGDNGLMYLLQIKAMELELIDNAINWSPSNLFKEMK